MATASAGAYRPRHPERTVLYRVLAQHFERFTLFDTLLIERLFRAEVLRLLMDKGLISQDVVDNLLSWNHSGFSVHADVKVGDRQAAARLGRYMIRCPVVVERMSLDENSGEVLCRTRPSRADHPEGPVARWDVYELPTPSEIATDEPQGSGGRLFANPQSEGSRLSRCPVGDVDVHRSLHTLPNIGKGDDQKEPLVIHPRGDNRELGANVAVEERLDHASTTASNASVLVTGLVRQNLPDGAEFFSSLLGDELRSNGVARMYRRDSSTPSVALSVERKR